MYTIFITGEDRRVPSTDADDAREETREMLKALRLRGHTARASVNGFAVVLEEEDKEEREVMS